MVSSVEIILILFSWYSSQNLGQLEFATQLWSELSSIKFTFDLFEDSTFNRLSVVVQFVVVFHFRGAVEFYEAGRLHPLQFDHVLHREELPGVEPDKNQVWWSLT